MSDENVGVDVLSGSHIKNVKNKPSDAFWLGLAGTSLILVAVIVFAFAISGFLNMHGVLTSWVSFIIMLVAPSYGLILILTPWVFRAHANPAKSVVPRVLAVSGLVLLSLFVSFNLIFACLQWG